MFSVDEIERLKINQLVFTKIISTFKTLNTDGT